jgi:hypothetical protein
VFTDAPTIRRLVFAKGWDGVRVVVEQYRERDDKFDVDADWVVPDLTAVIPAGAMIKQRTVSLSSRYFDTAALDLLRHG